MEGVHRREAHFRVFAWPAAAVDERRGQLYEIAGKYQGTVITKFDVMTLETELWLSVSESEASDAEHDLKRRGYGPRTADPPLDGTGEMPAREGFRGWARLFAFALTPDDDDDEIEAEPVPGPTL